MDIEKIIQTIVDNGDVKHMHMLSEILEDTMEEVRKYDEKCYKKYEMELYRMAYGPHLTREMAENIVSKMRPYGKKWTIEQAEELEAQYGIGGINPIDFFVVLNSAFNDYHDIFNDNIEMYVRFTVDFINDEDAKEDKVFLYFMNIPR